MTSRGGPSSEPRDPDRMASRTAPTWPRAAVVVALLVLAFVVSRGCQDAQIKVTQEEAVAAASEQIGFRPEKTIVRLLRQGLDRQPFWIVSLSIPIGDSDTTFRKLAVVRIDAATGEVVEVKKQRGGKQLERQGAP